MESRRRIILCGCTLAAVLIGMYASLEPVVIIGIFNPPKQQIFLPLSKSSDSLLSEEDRNMRARERQREIEANLTVIEGRAWEDVYTNLAKVEKGDRVPEAWSRRLPSDQHPMSLFFYRRDDTPVRTVSHLLYKDNQQLYLRFKDRDAFLKIDYRIFSDNDFHLGSGLSRYPHPPTDMLYPYRKYGLVILLSGIALYALLPRRKISPHTMRYPRWRIVCGDIASLLAIVPFFSFPFLITGGTLQAFTQGWPLFFFFWPVFIIGIWMLSIAVRLAAFSVTVKEDRLILSSTSGEKEFLFKDMAFFQPVVFRPPKWLIALSWLAVLAGKGSARLGAAGRAMMLSGSASGSINIRLRNGADIFINITDQMGNNALKGFENILHKLKEYGVEEKTETREIRSLGLETMRLPDTR
jgi:hypothetical protein